MEDKVGGSVPSEKDIAALGDLVEQVSTKIAKWTIVLTSDQRSRVVKPRTGFESVAVTIGNLAEKHGVVLPKISIAGMHADLALAARLAALREVVATLLQRIDDTILEARAEAYWASTAYYGSLSRMGDVDPELEASMKPVIEFFAIGKRARKASPAAPSAS